LFWFRLGFGCLDGRQQTADRQLAEIRAAGLPTNAAELNDFYRVPDDVTDTTDLWVAATRSVEA